MAIKPPKGMSPSSNPNRRRQTQPQPILPRDLGAGPGGRGGGGKGLATSPFPGPKGAKGGAQVKPTAGNTAPQPRVPTTATGTQPMNATAQRKRPPGGLTPRQQKLVSYGAKNALDVEGNSSRWVRRVLTRGIKNRGISRKEHIALGGAKAGIMVKDNGSITKRSRAKARKYVRRYKRNQG
jgi:hypothetical protein